MTSKFFFTAAATSKIIDQIDDAIVRTVRAAGSDRAKKLEDVQRKVDDLKSRGLLKKQKFVSTTTSEFERRYYLSKKVGQ